MNINGHIFHETGNRYSIHAERGYKVAWFSKENNMGIAHLTLHLQQLYADSIIQTTYVVKVCIYHLCEL